MPEAYAGEDRSSLGNMMGKGERSRRAKADDVGTCEGVSGGCLIPDVRKIVLVRANGLGDAVFVLPAIEALRAAYPEAEIVWLGTPLHETLFTQRRGPVDRVVVVPPSRGVRDEPGEDAQVLDDFFAQMQGEGLDLALQLHGGGRYSNPFVRRLGARVTAGMKTPDAEPLDRSIPYIYFQPEVLRYLEVVNLVGAAPRVIEPRLAVTDADCRAAEDLLPAPGRPCAVLHPGATDGRRRWDPTHFARTGDALGARGFEVVVIGVEEEAPLVQAVTRAMRLPAINLCGRLSLSSLIGLLTSADVFVGNDSGPLHLAGAVGAPTVGIFWCGNLINGGPVSRQRHRPTISWRLHCPVCGINCITGSCLHHVSFVDDVSVEEVLRHVDGLLTSSSAFRRPSHPQSADRRSVGPRVA